jgi:hypothetical protein
LNTDAAKSCLLREAHNNRILVAHFMTKKLKISFVVVYAPVNRTNGNSGDPN